MNSTYASSLKFFYAKVSSVWIIILLIAPLTVASAHAFQDPILDRKISIAIQQLPFGQALRQIESNVAIRFFYSEEQLNVRESISLAMENKTLREILEELLKPYNITYTVHAKESYIMLKRNTSLPRTTNVKPSEQPQPLSITGTVREETTGQPMPGVSILVKNSVNGTSTNANGSFTLQVPENAILIFSFIGYQSVEVPVNGRTLIEVSLKEDAKTLSEVMVNAGYYQVSDRERTGNISRVNAADIQKQPVSNPLATMQGRVPGLEIIQQSGVPGANFQVRIRGTNSIANGKDPLYIIDGVPFVSETLAMPETSGLIAGPGGFSPLNSINPADILSMEVLKDADATAIYGSRGANGVVLITTKKGVQGKTKIDLNVYSGIGKVSNTMQLLQTNQYLQMRREAFQNDNVIPTMANARDLLQWDTTRYTDWQQVLIGGTAKITDAQLNMSGGTATTQFIIGGGFHKETTVFPGDNRDTRVSLHTQLNHSAFDQKLRMNFSMNYSVNNTNLLQRDLTRNALILPPIAPALKQDNGNLNWQYWSATYENPLANTQRIYEGHSNTIVGNSVINYALRSNVILRTSLGFTSMNNKAVTTNPIRAQAPDGNAVNTTDFSNAGFQSWIAEPQLNWTPTIGHSRIDVLLGSTFLGQSSEGLAQQARGFSSEALMKNLSAATMVTQGTEYYSQYRYQAFFGRINYTWRDKYLVNFTGRRDGSSRFGSGNQFSMFGAAGMAWIISDEKFIQENLKFLSFAKLRASYGVTGNDQLGDYKYLDTYTSSLGAYQGKIGLAPDRLSNPNFAWEKNNKLETGLELAFLNDRIRTSTSFYRNRSSNQLVGYPLPATTGFTTIQGNFPATVQNQGAEIEFTTINVQTPSSFSWITSFNLTVPRNKLISFPNLEAFPAYANLYVVGQPLSIRKVYDYTGLSDDGIYTVADVNEDGSYNAADRQTIANVSRQYFGGLSNTFRYKGIELDILFQFVKQAANTYTMNFETPGTLSNQPQWVMDRWQPEAPASTVQRFGQQGVATTAYTRFNSSENAVGDASFIRLKNVSLSWSLPAAWLTKAHLTNARIFLQAQNLLTLTRYKGLDPETQFGTVLPPLRMITYGVHITL